MRLCIFSPVLGEVQYLKPKLHSAREEPPFPAMQVRSHGQVLKAQKLNVPILPMQL